MEEPNQIDGLARRVTDVMLRPRAAWDRIAGEPTTAPKLFKGYVLILAAINPVCWTLGRLIFGERVLGTAYRPPLIGALLEAVIGYLLILGSVYVLALLIEHLAPPFGAAKDRLSAFKVAAYSGTSGWLASVAYLVPVLQPLAIIGVLYGLYLLYLGVKHVMAPPSARALGYVVLVVVCYVVLMMLATSLTKLLAALL